MTCWRDYTPEEIKWSPCIAQFKAWSKKLILRITWMRHGTSPTCFTDTRNFASNLDCSYTQQVANKLDKFCPGQHFSCKLFFLGQISTYLWRRKAKNNHEKCIMQCIVILHALFAIFCLMQHQKEASCKTDIHNESCGEIHRSIMLSNCSDNP